MSDLVKRLRKMRESGFATPGEAADRIEELESQVRKLEAKLPAVIEALTDGMCKGEDFQFCEICQRDKSLADELTAALTEETP